MFLTLTCDGYGKVRDDGTPADPASYDGLPQEDL